MYNSFLKKLEQVIQLRRITTRGSDIGTIITSSWLRSQLSSLLDHHMAYRCCVKKYGTLLYRHGGDILHALNVSLGQMRHQSHQSNRGRGDPEPVLKKTGDNFQQTQAETCLVLNSKIHTCIDSMLKQYYCTMQTYVLFTFAS